MAMTWAELRDQIVDLGFEEDTITEEYARLIRNSVNRALDIINVSVVPDLEDYYAKTESWGYYDDSTEEWILPKPRHITATTADEQKINLADNLLPLVPLLAAYYVWLDDDITKAVMYHNDYDELKQEIFRLCKRPKKATIEGGW